MSDNPLADWLRAAEAGSSGTETPAVGDEAGAGAGAGQANGHESTGEPPAGRAPAPWEEPLEPGSGGNTRRRVAAASVAVWLVVGALGALAVARGGFWAGSLQAAGEPPAVAADAATRATGDGSDMAAGAVAATAVRQAVTRAATAGADGQRYVDLAMPEAVEHHGPVMVVTVRAVLLEGSADAWHTARTTRFAVPVALRDGQMAVVGAPWALPGGHPPRDEDEGWLAADVDDELVHRALEDAGYRDLTGLELAARADLPGLLRARMEGRAPGDTDGAAHEVWLRAGPPPTVLGLPPDQAPEHP